MSNPFLPLIEGTETRRASQNVTYREAVVTQTEPRVEVQFFTDETSTPLTKPPLVSGLEVGDMVMCMMIGQTLTVSGKYGGSTPAPPDNTVLIGGKAYVANGTVVAPAFSLSQYGTVWAGTASIPVPYVPPTGYGFEVFALQSSGFTVVATAGQNAQTITLRIIQVGSGSTTALTHIGWRLIRR